MGAFADRAKANATRQINDKGDDVTLVRRYGCSYDPTTGIDACTEDLYPVKGVISNYLLEEVDDTKVMGGDLRLLVQFPMDITKTWEVEYLTKRWEIIDVTYTRTQNETVVQGIQMRAVA